jgi:hypothetical protein
MVHIVPTGLLRVKGRTLIERAWKRSLWRIFGSKRKQQ